MFFVDSRVTVACCIMSSVFLPPLTFIRCYFFMRRLPPSECLDLKMWKRTKALLTQKEDGLVSRHNQAKTLPASKCKISSLCDSSKRVMALKWMLHNFLDNQSHLNSKQYVLIAKSIEISRTKFFTFFHSSPPRN